MRNTKWAGQKEELSMKNETTAGNFACTRYLDRVVRNAETAETKTEIDVEENVIGEACPLKAVVFYEKRKLSL